MSNNDVLHRVQNELAKVEAQYGVRVLYACESGSRAWGFASRDSDYDVRFLYVHPRDWYLSLENHRDVIEMNIHDDLDVSGWELRKALRLLKKSNPPLLEWLKSPVVYAHDEAFLTGFRELSEVCHSPTRCFAHYLHMASGNVREYLKGETVWLKKYLYVLRPLLACRWIERGLGQVPMRFDELVYETVDDMQVLVAIADLVTRKMAGDELDRGPRVEALDEFIHAEIPRLRRVLPPEETAPEAEPLNRFFQRQCLAA